MSELGRINSVMPQRLEQLVGVGLTAIAFMGSPGAAEAGSPIKHAGGPGTLSEFQMRRQPDQLPGASIHVSRAARLLLAKSTVKIYQDSAPSSPGATDGMSEAWCTGVKVRLPDNSTDISTAAHCFVAETGQSNGLLNAKLFPQTSALDFINRATPFLTYDIRNPEQPESTRQSLATAASIAISTRSHDAALLKVTPDTLPAPKAGPVPPDYSAISDMAYASNIHLIPGQKVGLLGVPESNNNDPVSSTGIYLGRVTDIEMENNTVSSDKLDVVLTHPDQPYNDACYYGASGSSFVADEKVGSATGKYDKVVISGPLSRRVNSKYDPYLMNNSVATTEKGRIQQALMYDRVKRQRISHELGVNIKPDDTICEYTVLDKPTTTNLQNAFGKLSPALLAGKGGGPSTGMK